METSPAALIAEFCIVLCTFVNLALCSAVKPAISSVFMINVLDELKMIKMTKQYPAILEMLVLKPIQLNIIIEIVSRKMTTLTLFRSKDNLAYMFIAINAPTPEMR